MTRFHKQVVTLKLGDGTEYEQPALVLGGLAVTPTCRRITGEIEAMKGSFTVSHTTSGGCIIETHSQRRAKEFVERLLHVADWTLPFEKLNSQELRQAVNEIVGAYYLKHPKERYG